MSVHGGDWAGFQTEYGTLPLDFSANISPLGLPEGVKEALISSVEDAEHYPDAQCRALKEALSNRHGVPHSAIVCGNGAADLIFRLVLMLRPHRALVAVPTFSEYENALRLSGCATEVFPLREENGFILTEDILDAVTEQTEMLFLCNPNNPTGRLISQELLLRILQRCEETGTYLLLDECFLDFARDGEEQSLLRLLPSSPHLVILRAFTKIYAMPGLRLGYAVCGSEKMASRLEAFSQPWPVSSLAMKAGLAALKVENYVNQVRAMVAQERAFLTEGLTGLGMRVVPGEANYLLFACGDEALAKKLRSEGILLRTSAGFTGLPACWYRTAVKTRRDNEILLQAIGRILYGS